MKKFRLPLVLFSLLIATYLFGGYISYDIKAFFLSVSMTLKCILLFVLPLIIFSFITSSLLSLEGNVIKFTVLLLLCVFLSNSMAIYTGYFVGKGFLDFLITSPNTKTKIDALTPLWVPHIPTLISNELTLILGFAFGIIFSIKRNQKVEKVTQKISKLSTQFLNKFFIPVLPLFVFGFILKLQHEDVLEYVMKVYGKVLLVIVSTQISYLCVAYLIASNFSIKRLAQYISAVLPATLTGFSTLSSAASMGVLITSMERIFKNKHTPNLYKAIIPSVINIHIVGSAIGMTILALATIKSCGMQTPTLHVFAIFALFYGISTFAVVAVPGGVLLIVIPLLEKYLAFSPEMIGVVTVVYLLFDPFGTATNITMNGGFTIIFSKIFNFLTKRKIS